MIFLDEYDWFALKGDFDIMKDKKGNASLERHVK